MGAKWVRRDKRFSNAVERLIAERAVDDGQLNDALETLIAAREITATTPTLTADADAVQAIGRVSVAHVVTGAWYIPRLSLTGDPANYRTFTVGSLDPDAFEEVIVAAQLALSSGEQWFGNRSVVELPLAATVADRTIPAGWVVHFQSFTTGTGMIDPGGLVIVAIEPV